jgi:hypothetical protein
LQKIRQLVPNLVISFSAFSLVYNPTNWQNYLIAYEKIIPLINSTLWMSYNINIDPIIANNWYSSRNLTDISNLGVPINSVFYGYCLNYGCVYGIGPNQRQILMWAQDVKNQNGGGLFLWSIGAELAELNFNMTAFNTVGLSKQISNIIRGI